MVSHRLQTGRWRQSMETGGTVYKRAVIQLATRLEGDSKLVALFSPPHSLAIYGHQNVTTVSDGQAPTVSGGQAMMVSGCQPSSGFPAKTAPSMGSSSVPLEFILVDNMEGNDDVNQEWLSLLVEDCLSSISCYPAFPQLRTTTIIVAPIGPPIQECVAQSISRAKQSKLTPTIIHVTPYDPPLLHQPHWLAVCELIYPKKRRVRQIPKSQLRWRIRE